MDPLIIEEAPSLRDPILVVAYAGWNDAGEAATSAVKFLSEQTSARCFARIDPEEFYSFATTRPLIRFRDAAKSQREIVWPKNEFFYSCERTLPRDVIFGLGVEPHLRWRAFAGAILGLARGHGVRMVITLGALLAEIPHTRPIRITGSSTDPDLAAKVGLQGSHYEGPTGIVGVFFDACRREGLQVISLWANVPHYVAAAANPPAVLTLARRAATLLQFTPNFAELEGAAAEFTEKLSEVVAQDPKVSAYIAQLEAQEPELSDALADPLPGLSSGTDIEAEIQRFLRQYRQQHGQN